MWDLKLIFFDSFLMINLYFSDFFFFVYNMFDPFLHNGPTFTGVKFFYQFPQNLTFFFALKFCLAIFFLVLIRGGTPRYRYDFLTKLGWLKFLTLVLVVFFISLFFVFIY